jgi:DNA-binding transcriptional MocR family regulator
MPGDIFYENPEADLDIIKTVQCNQNEAFIKGNDTFRIGFGRVSDDAIRKGIEIIGKNIHLLEAFNK